MAEKLGADAFLYMDPEPDTPDFAQCSSCRDWVRDDELCVIHGPHLMVPRTASCGLYVYGEPHKEAATYSIVTATESGLVDREVRCENCSHSKGNTCGLFALLNDKLPDTFEIDTDIDPKGCCNAQQPK